MMRTPDERGSMSLFFAVLAIALLATVGLVVDGGGKIRAIQSADQVAAEAARTAGQQIVGSSAVRGEPPVIDPVAARQAAEDYVGRSGSASSASTNFSITGFTITGRQITVDVTTKYSPIFLSLIGENTQDVTGHATVTLLRGIGAPE